MLIEHGADVAAQNNDWETPLHLASRWGRVEVARILIECGADVTAQNMYGETPLHLALVWVLVELARMLTQHDIDVAAQSKDGEISYYLAASQTGQAEIARMLIERGAEAAMWQPRTRTGRHPYIWRLLADTWKSLVCSLSTARMLQHRIRTWRLHYIWRTGRIHVLSNQRNLEKFLSYCSNKAQM